MQPWAPGHEHQLSLGPCTEQNWEAAGQQTHWKAGLRGTTSAKSQDLQSHCKEGAGLRGKCLPSSGHHSPHLGANWCHWPGWGAGAACPALGEGRSCALHRAHTAPQPPGGSTRCGDAAPGRDAAPSQGCSPRPHPSSGHTPEESLVGGMRLERAGLGSTASPPAAPKPSLHAGFCAHQAAATQGLFPPLAVQGAVLEPPQTAQGWRQSLLLPHTPCRGFTALQV